MQRNTITTTLLGINPSLRVCRTHKKLYTTANLIKPECRDIVFVVLLGYRHAASSYQL